MSKTLVKVDNVSKKYCKSLKKSLWYGVKDIGKEIIGRKNNDDNKNLREHEFWAVDGVSFELKRGDCLGLIGENGAGKSTLLKMLNGLVKLDSGRIEMNGKVGAMIQLGAGFNPILSGRENIYINASILGFTRAEINKKLDSIINFAEIGDFIDMPVQNYSSGMTVRLGFAIASQLEPDILLIDEVLAVGDMGFVIKCLNAINKLMKNSAVILVSHSMPHISRICNKLVVMRDGNCIYNADNVNEGIDIYFQRFKSPISDYIGSEKAELLNIELSSKLTIDQNNSDVFMINYLDDLIIDLDFKIDNFYTNPSFGLVFYNLEMRNVAEAGFVNEEKIINNDNGHVSVRATVPKINLNRGLYTITVIVSQKESNGSKILLRAQSVQEFQVVGIHVGWATIRYHTKWKQIKSNRN